jgi:HSP20 family protein
MSTTIPSRVSQGLSALRHGNPLRTLQEDFDDLLNRFSREVDSDWMTRPFAPAMDVSESDGEVQVKVDVPGIEAKDVKIEVVGDTLRISGERTEEKEEKGDTWHRVERRFGSFSRSVTLPCAVKQNAAKAVYVDGVLTVNIPKAEVVKPHRIPVKSNGK